MMGHTKTPGDAAESPALTVRALIEQVNDIRMIAIRSPEPRRDLDAVRTRLADRLVLEGETPAARV